MFQSEKKLFEHQKNANFTIFYPVKQRLYENIDVNLNKLLMNKENYNVKLLYLCILIITFQ